LIGDAVSHYKEHANGLLNIVYGTSIKHAGMLADAFNAAGIKAAAVSSKTPDDELANIIKAFARRELKCIANCDLLTFGFDLSAAAGMNVTIESMSDLGPTQSMAKQLQKWGRVLRAKDKPALIFDHAGNIDEHDMPDAEREWTLDGRDKKKGASSEKTKPVRQCPKCYFCDRPAPVCGNCGFVFPVASRMIEEVDGDLEEVTAPRMKPRQEAGMVAAKDGLAGLLRLEKERGYKPGLARMAWQHSKARRSG
jgi:superfamily II DNA or RNA helicase